MSALAWGKLGLFIAILAAGIWLAEREAGKPPPPPERRELEPILEPVEPPDPAEALYEAGLALEEQGDDEGAEKYFLEAAREDPAFEPVMSKLRNILHNVRKPAALNDPAALRKLALWAFEAGLTEEAEVLQAMAEKKSEEVTAIAKLTPREKKALALKDWFLGAFNGSGKRFRDLGPELPYLLCIETQGVLAKEEIDAMERAVRGAYATLLKRCGGKAIADDGRVLGIYVFATRDRYRDLANVPGYFQGHFDPVKGHVFVARDTETPLDTLAHLATLQGFYSLAQPPRAEVAAGSPRTIPMWIAEGLAGAHGEAGDGTVAAGSRKGLELLQGRIREGKHVRLPEFMAKLHHEFLTESLADGDLYIRETRAEAWSLVHFLHESGRYRHEFADYLKRELAGEADEAALMECFGDLRKLNDEWEKYVLGLR